MADESRFPAYNVMAVMPDMETARSAYASIERSGIESEKISLLGPGVEEAAAQPNDEAQDAGVAADTVKGAAVGSAVGGVTGGVAGALAGLAAFAIPGVGPVIGAGIWAATIGGAIAGASVGGVIGGVTHLPTGEAWELTYQSVREGRVLVVVHSDSQAEIDTVAKDLQKAGALRIDHFDAEGRLLPAA